MHYFTAAIPFLASGLLPLAQAFVEQSTALDKTYSYDYEVYGQEWINVKASMKMMDGYQNELLKDASTQHRIQGQTVITVGADEYSVSYILDRNTFRVLAPNGDGSVVESTNQSVMVHGAQEEYTYMETITENFPGTWWTVDSNEDKEAQFQVVTAFSQIYDDDFAKSSSINPSYWPHSGSSIRFQFWVEPQNIYLTTFVDYGHIDEAESDECTSYVQTAIRNELWVGSKVLGKRTWLADDVSQNESESEYCTDNLVLLHEAGDNEELSTKDGVAKPAVIAASAAAGLALLAYCTFRVTKRAPVDDYFSRV